LGAERGGGGHKKTRGEKPKGVQLKNASDGEGLQERNGQASGLETRDMNFWGGGRGEGKGKVTSQKKKRRKKRRGLRLEDRGGKITAGGGRKQGGAGKRKSPGRK